MLPNTAGSYLLPQSKSPRKRFPTVGRDDDDSEKLVPQTMEEGLAKRNVDVVEYVALALVIE